jgi:drug/metabolite transporter (DMT)-like permease
LWLGKRLDLRLYWRHYLAIGFLNSALPFLLFAYAAQSLSASLLSILNATSALWGAIIAAFWLRIPITRSIALGLLFGLAGVVLLVGNGVALTGDAGWTPIAAGLIAPLCYAIASNYTKANPSTATPFANTHGSMWMAGLLCLPVVFFAPIRQTPLLGDWAALAALGVFCTGVAYLLYFSLIQEIGPTRALSVTFLIPVFGVLWGALFLHEPIGWDKLTGGVLVLAGISLTTGLVKFPLRKPS